MGGVELRDIDAPWAERFERERERIRAASPVDPRGTFHVGSTAVPDLPAKPALDVLAVYPDREAFRAAVAALRDDGYYLNRDESDWVVLGRDPAGWSVALHLRPPGAEGWRDRLVLRAYLRDSAAARREYERAKRAAAARHPDDVSAYTDAKEGTIRSLTAEAWERGYDAALPAWTRRNDANGSG